MQLDPTTVAVVVFLTSSLLAIIGYFLKDAHSTIKSQQKQLDGLIQELGKLELRITTGFVRNEQLTELKTDIKEDIAELSAALFGRLDRIELKLDGKADKQHA